MGALTDYFATSPIPMNKLVVIVAAIILPLVTFAAEAIPQYTEHINALNNERLGYPVSLHKVGTISTKASFKPPIEILVEAKIESTNLRLGYAADQLIFNWERDISQLRVDGGPANGKHKFGMGRIPTKQYVVVRWVVTPTKQSVFVDGQLRFEHIGDYSRLDRPLTIFGSGVTVKSIKTRQLPASN
jgi:hypothetical protein